MNADKAKGNTFTPVASNLCASNDNDSVSVCNIKIK